MLLLTINYVPGKEIEALGIVKGNVVQSKHIGNAGRSQGHRYPENGRGGESLRRGRSDPGGIFHIRYHGWYGGDHCLRHCGKV